MAIIHPEEELSNKRLSERRSAVITPLIVSRISCSECFAVNNVNTCIHCKKSLCSVCLKNNQCEECYYKYNSCLIRIYKCLCRFK